MIKLILLVYIMLTILWQDASCNYKDQQTFIDLAATMGYEYILIDALWDKQIGYENMITECDSKRNLTVGGQF